MSGSGGRYSSGRPHRLVRRRCRRRSPLIRWLRYGPPGELLEVLGLPFRRHPLLAGFGAVTALWWFWPWIRTPAPHGAGVPDVVAVEITDHRRTRTALEIWRNRPGSQLALMAPPGAASEFSLHIVRGTQLSDDQRRRLILIPTCGDTITELADLSEWLGSLRTSGQLLLVTSPAHLSRMTAIGQVMLGGRGWRVEGAGSLSSEHKPESPLRLIRDQLRAQLWRATGWTGKNSLICPGRARGLF